MATLIPSISTCASRMTSGERRVEDKLDHGYLPWYDVPKRPRAIPSLKPVTPGTGLRGEWHGGHFSADTFH